MKSPVVTPTFLVKAGRTGLTGPPVQFLADLENRDGNVNAIKEIVTVPRLSDVSVTKYVTETGVDGLNGVNVTNPVEVALLKDTELVSLPKVSIQTTKVYNISSLYETLTTVYF